MLDHWRPWLLLVVVLLGAGLLRARLFELPLERDEGEYAYHAQLMLRGVAPYTEAYEMKPPGVLAAYAATMAVFGESATAIRLGLALANAMTAILLFLLVRRWVDVDAGLAAATSFVGLSLAPGVLGPIANTEQFVLPAAVGGLLLASRGGAASAVAAGGSLGFACLVKQPAIAFLTVGMWLAWRSGESTRASATRAATLAGGAVLCIGLVLGLLALVGSWEPFWFWTVTYAIQYAGAESIGQVFSELRLERIVGWAWPLWVVALAGAVVAALARPLRPIRSVLFVWLGMSLVAVALPMRFRPQHFVLLMPALATLVGVAASMARKALPQAPRAAATACVVVPLAALLWGERALFFEMDPRSASRHLYDGPNPFPESIEVARYIREHSAPDDRIAVLGSEPQIYFYSGRRSATPYILTYELSRSHEHARRMQREMIADLKRTRPKFIVYVGVGSSWSFREGAPDDLFAWFWRVKGGPYVRVKQFDLPLPTRKDYAWTGGVEPSDVQAAGWISLWQRRDSLRPSAEGQRRPDR